MEEKGTVRKCRVVVGQYSKCNELFSFSHFSFYSTLFSPPTPIHNHKFIPIFLVHLLSLDGELIIVVVITTLIRSHETDNTLKFGVGIGQIK